MDKNRINIAFSELEQEIFLEISDIKINKTQFDKFKKFVTEMNEKYPTIKNYYMRIGNKFIHICDSYNGLTFSSEEDKDITLKEMGIKLKEEFIETKEVNKKIKEILEISNLNHIIYKLFHYSNYDSDEVDDRFEIKNDKQEFFVKLKEHIKILSNNFCEFNFVGQKEFMEEFFNYDVDSEEEAEREENLKCAEIFKVFEKDNMRFVLMKDDGYSNGKFFVCNPDCSFYNYMDEKRKILLNYRANLIFDEDTKIEDINFMNNNLNYGDFREQFNYIPKEELKKITNSLVLKQRVEEAKEKQEDELKEKIISELEEKGEVVLSGIKRFKSGFFEYGNQKIGFEDYKIFKISNGEKDFEVIFNLIVNDYTFNFQENFKWKEKQLYCGSFKVELKAKGNYNYIEGIRINKKEIREALQKSICYQKKEDYIKFLNEVSYCSIKIHNVLANGLRYDLKNKGHWNKSEAVWSKINIIRKKNKHFIKDKQNEYSISNLNNLISLEKASEFNSNILIDRLMINTSINSKHEALVLIKNGLKEYRESLKRAKILLKETIEALNIREVAIESEEHTGNGYVVKGKSGKEYFVTDNLKVYEYPKMTYLCIINKSGNDLCNNDLLVSRLYALSNDNQTREHIYTLN